MTKQISKQGQRLFALLLAVAMMFTAMPMNAIAVEASDVNEDGYIEVYTIEDLYSIRNDLTAKYILMNDINLTAATTKGGDWDFMGNGWNPIGSDDIYGSLAFSGEFNGNGKRIIGMRIDGTTMPSGVGTKYVGLFANVTGSVHDLVLENTVINWPQSGTSYIGSVAGMNSGSIYNISADVTITLNKGTSNLVGGIVGRSQGTVSRCSTAGSIKYTYSYSSGSVHTSGVGGIVGYATGGTISECYNTATLEQRNTSSGSYGFVGGICGQAYYYSGWSGSTTVNIENCYNTGDITSNNGYYIAGILGCTDNDGSQKHTISNCYNIGTCTAKSTTSAAGPFGIVELKTGTAVTVTDCYYLYGTGKSNTGATSLTAGQLKLQSSYSALDFDSVWVMDTDALYPYPQLRNNPQDLRVVENVIIASEPTKTEYKFGEAIDLKGASLQVEYTNGTSELIDITEDMLSGYAPAVPGVQNVIVTYKGIINSFNVKVNEIVYIPVYTIEDLYNIRDDLSSNYILMNDIDLTAATAKDGDWDFNGCGWNPIGSNDIYSNEAFSGEFNGNGHKITGMRIDITSVPSGTDAVYAGLFANVTGSVKNLTVSGSINYNVTKAYYLGSVAAVTTGTIENCHVSVNITGFAESSAAGHIGGIASTANDATIINCSNNGNISLNSDTSTSGADKYAGGIAGVGDENTVITNSYNTGSVYAKAPNGYWGYSEYGYAYVAGICWKAIISNCYNVGSVQAVKEYEYSRAYANGIGGTTTNCYNLGQVTGGTSKYAISTNESVNCYYLDGSGTSNTGSTALTESQMKIKSMFKNFDFDNVWVLNEYANHPYPQLKNNIQDMGESASLVSVIKLPNKTNYMTGDKLDFTGAIVKVVYVSGREETIEITDDIASGFDMNVAGEQQVIVTVAGASDHYTINVVDRPVVEAITITSQPNTKIFAVGAVFDFTGAKALVSYVGGITETVDITPDMTIGGDINHIGKQTITYAFGGKSASFEVEVVGIELEKIVLTKLPDKLNYLEGQELDLTGMVVTAVMNNGIENTVGTGYTVSGYSSEPGDYIVTVTYLEKTATFNVKVVEKSLVSLALNALPDKLEYVSGQTFDASGMQVIATYDNGDVVVTEQYTVSGFDSVPGIKNVVISLEGKSISFTVKVIARVVTEFKLTTLPTKLDYIEYDSLDTKGLKVEATYNDGITEEITDYELTGFSSKPGTHTITIAYEGFTRSFEINVTPRVLVDIKVKAPNKVAYYIGDEFDATGLVVTACYNNGQEITVDDYQLVGFDSNSAGAKTIIVTHGGISRSFAVAVQERSVIETGGNMIVGNLIGRLGETVVIPVNVTKNTGIAGFTHTINFDATALKLVSVDAVGGYADGTVILNDEKIADGEITVLWFGSEDIEGDGVVYNLTFEILETAQDGNAEITISFDDNDNGNISGENVIFGTMNGFVEVRSYWLGDLNGDREYHMVDLLQLAQYVSGKEMTLTEKQLLSADVNEDTVIDIHDVIMLQQWIIAAGVPEA